MSKILRYPDWASRLQTFLISRDPQPFEWGVNDCALFSCDAIIAMTGIDLAASYRRLYSTQRGATRVIKRLTGGLSVEDAASNSAFKHGMPEVSPLAAQRGDLLLLKGGGEEGFHSFLGLLALSGKSAIAVSDSGLIEVPLTRVLRAWKV